jgi:2-dehydropantoate 2-reductase
MRVLVVGAGIIGSVYGWALAESGHHVVHLVRPGRADSLREGLPLDVFDRRKGRKRNFCGLYRLDVLETLPPTETFELVIVPVKHYALIQTLKEIVPHAGNAEFLLLTQNWRGVAEIDSILPRTRYIYGDAKAGGTISDGTLVAALKTLDIGSPEGEPSALAKKVAALFASADIPTRLHSGMLHYLWVQYAIAAGTWPPFVRAGSFAALFNDRDATLAVLSAGRECLQVVARRGVDISRYADTRPLLSNSALRRRFYIWAMRRMFLHDEYTKRCSAHALGDPVEVKTFYDDLITTGHELGVLMPVMERYAEVIRRFATTAHKTGMTGCRAI